MDTFFAGQFDIAVIGAGHAGIEAALAAARLGLETIVFTINLDAVGNMPCNPAIGGTGKGHLVRELDALGGEMARAADECCIQYRLLNLRKGPAVWSLRAQADRRKYQERMKHTLELQDHLTVRQGQVTEVRTEHGAVSAVALSTGAVYGGAGCGSGHGHVSEGPHHHRRLRGGLRPGRNARCRAADGLPFEAGAASAAVQDRYAAPGQRPDGRL